MRRQSQGLNVLELHLSLSGVRAGIPAKARFARWLDCAFVLAMQQKGRNRLRFVELPGISVRLVDRAEGQQFNAQYRGKNYATNVLSFPFEVPPGLPKTYPREWLGDLIICAPVIEAEAAEQGKSLHTHYAHMSVHGLLHLLGWDHEESVAAEAMEALEVKILAQLGFANPYLEREIGS